MRPNQVSWDGKSFFHFCEFRDEGGDQFASLNQVRNLDIFVGGMNVGVEMPNTGGYGGDAQKISEPAVRTGTGHHGKKRRLCPISLFSSRAKNHGERSVRDRRTSPYLEYPSLRGGENGEEHDVVQLAKGTSVQETGSFA